MQDGGMKYGAGLSVEQRLARVEQLVIAKSIGTSKGALVGFSASGQPIEIPAAPGNGYGIDSDTSQTGGMKWQAKPTYTTPSYGTGWADYDAVSTGWRGGGYTIDRDGFVCLIGLIKRTTATAGHQTIFTLPAGYRPLEQQLYILSCVIGGTITACRVDIDTAGVVQFVTSVASAIGYLPLNNIPPFLAGQ